MMSLHNIRKIHNYIQHIINTQASIEFERTHSQICVCYPGVHVYTHISINWSTLSRRVTHYPVVNIWICWKHHYVLQRNMSSRCSCNSEANFFWITRKSWRLFFSLLIIECGSWLYIQFCTNQPSRKGLITQNSAQTE